MIFFFSSRRRHTRWNCDWSSDVCSSDLLKIAPNNRMPAIIDNEPLGGGAPISIFESGAIMMYIAEKAGKFWPQAPREKYRSEERRVGKECRCRWSEEY